MCVLTATAIATGISVAAGTALGVVSSIQQSKAQEAQANYQIQVQNENARIAREKAKQEAQEGLNKERLQRMKNIQTLGAQKASLASKGADINFGTPLDLLEDTAMGGELDALNIRYDTQKRVNQYDQNAIDFSNKANYLSTMSDFNKKQSAVNAAKIGYDGLMKLGQSNFGNNSLKII